MSAPAGVPVRVLVVDDHSVVRDGLTALLGRQPDMHVVGEAADGHQALEALLRLRPDVTLLDLRLPGLSGLDVLRRALGEWPAARVLVLTTYDGEEDIYQALRAGARGYLLKDASREELLEAVRAVHRGARRVPAAVAERLAERIPGSELTPREHDVLRLIVAGLANKEIAARLGLTEGTVKGYVNTLLPKLGAEDRTQAAIAAVRRGLVHLE